MHERRAFDLSRPRALRAPGSEYFLHQSLASTASFSGILRKFLVIIAGKNSRERKKRRDTKKQREKNTNTIYDIKYAAIFHVQNDVRVPRRHFSFHRHLTHVLRRPGRRREHFTFHFLVFPVSFNCVFFYFVLLLSSLRVFFTTDQETRRKIKSKDISRSARERIKKRKKRRTF